MNDLSEIIDRQKKEIVDFIDGVRKAIYEQGRADKYKEMTSAYMLLTKKQVEEIRAEAIDECFNKIKQRLNDDTEISFDLPVEEVLGNDVDMDDFLMLAEEIVQKYKGLIFSKLKEAKHQLKEQKNE